MRLQIVLGFTLSALGADAATRASPTTARQRGQPRRSHSHRHAKRRIHFANAARHFKSHRARSSRGERVRNRRCAITHSRCHRPVALRNERRSADHPRIRRARRRRSIEFRNVARHPRVARWISGDGAGRSHRVRQHRPRRGRGSGGRPLERIGVMGQRRRAAS